MSNKELDEARNYFRSLDSDGDGLLSCSEFSVMLQKIGLNLNRNEVARLFEKADKDKTGKISFHEFTNSFLKKRDSVPSIERLREVFTTNDRNQDGHLNHEECFLSLKQLGHVLDDPGLKRVISIMDKNGDGRISFHEFCKFMQ